jgi:hypothetical protein
MRRIGRHHLAGHQPVKQHADAGEVLLYRAHLAQFLDVSGHMHRLYVLNARDASVLAPSQEGTGGTAISGAGVRVADVDGEELQEAPGGLFSRRADQRRYGQA